jgi:magnesium-transporting ATPase (P-type)
VANVYFLGISLLMMLGTYAPQVFESPLSAYSTLGPLALVLAITMAKEGAEDWKRHSSDREVNNRLCPVVGHDGSIRQVKWEDLTVGMVIKVDNKGEVPADVIVLQTSEPKSACYVETSNIDGETNLKLKEAVGISAGHITRPADAARIEGTLEYEGPNDRIHTFTGRMTLSNAPVNPSGAAPSPGGSAGASSPVGARNMVLRGCTLRNTHWILGLVVYSGRDTKVMKKSGGARSKMSQVEKTMNMCIKIIFGAQAILCTITTILAAIWNNQYGDDLPYLYITDSTYVIPTWMANWLTFLVLFNNFIPISLYVTVEVVNYVQAWLIDNDRGMWCSETDTKAKARTSNLNQDLGQIEYVFSDKTGTLTRNIMEFKQCSVGGRVYGVFIPEGDGVSSGGSKAVQEAEAEAAAADAAADSSCWGPLAQCCRCSSQDSSSTPRDAASATAGNVMAAAAGGWGGNKTPNSAAAAAQQQRTIELARTYSAIEPISKAASGTPGGATAPNPFRGGEGSGAGAGAGAGNNMVMVSPAGTSAASSAGVVPSSPRSTIASTGKMGLMGLGGGGPLSPIRSPGNASVSATEDPSSPVSSGFDDPFLLNLLRWNFNGSGNNGGSSSVRNSTTSTSNGTPTASAANAALLNAGGTPVTGTGTGAGIPLGCGTEWTPDVVVAAAKLATATDPRATGSKGTSNLNPIPNTAQGASQESVVALEAFFTCMAVCHTVVPETDEKNPTGPCIYQAESPDEAALTKAARDAGFEFITRNADSVIMARKNGDKKQEYKFMIHGVHEFNSTRKRMSVVCQNPEGRFFIMVKGADNVIFERAVHEPYRKELENHLTKFASDGLRTLVLAQREMTQEEFSRWKEDYMQASLAMTNRDDRLAEVAEAYETSLHVLGATAIEDRLQDGVPGTIRDLARAGIKTWVLTGDKVETAINIGFSCRLLDSSMELIKVAAEDEATVLMQLAFLEKRFHPLLHRPQSVIKRLLQWRPKSLPFSGSNRTTRGSSVILGRGSVFGGEADGQPSAGGPGNRGSRASTRSSFFGSFSGFGGGNSLAGAPTGGKDAPALSSVHIPPEVLAAMEAEMGGGGGDTASEAGGSTARGSIAGTSVGGGALPGGDGTGLILQTNMALVITGLALTHIIGHPARERALLTVARCCRAVIACRVSPQQKANIVRMVRRGITPAPMTLAIGDGANDVGMIQRAEVGIGISGKEGLQAVNSADFAIAQFRFLRRLLLVHGRWDYRRMTKVVLYSFYKNVVITLCLFYYNAMAAFSGTSFYESMVYSSFNFVLGLPIIFTGITDRDIKASTALAHPSVYAVGLRYADLNMKKILTWIAWAVLHSVIVFWVFFGVMGANSLDGSKPVENGWESNGQQEGLYVQGTGQFSVMLWAMQFEVLMQTVSWTWLTYLMMAISMGGYYIFLLIYAQMFSFAPDFYGVAVETLARPTYWLIIILVMGIMMLVDWTVELCRRQYNPTPSDIAAELDRGYGVPGAKWGDEDLGHSGGASVTGLNTTSTRASTVLSSPVASPLSGGAPSPAPLSPGFASPATGATVGTTITAVQPKREPSAHVTPLGASAAAAGAVDGATTSAAGIAGRTSSHQHHQQQLSSSTQGGGTLTVPSGYVLQGLDRPTLAALGVSQASSHRGFVFDSVARGPSKSLPTSPNDALVDDGMDEDEGDVPSGGPQSVAGPRQASRKTSSVIARGKEGDDDDEDDDDKPHFDAEEQKDYARSGKGRLAAEALGSISSLRAASLKGGVVRGSSTTINSNRGMLGSEYASSSSIVPPQTGAGAGGAGGSGTTAAGASAAGSPKTVSL